MILTTHALAGAVIGKNISQPWIIITLSIIIHFIMDTFRHGEYVELFSKNTSIKKSGWKIALDIFIGFSFLSLLFGLDQKDVTSITNVIIGIIASVFPDFVTFLYWKFRWKFLKRYYDFHSWIHKYPRNAPERQWTLQNATNDILISTIAIILLFT